MIVQVHVLFVKLAFVDQIQVSWSLKLEVIIYRPTLSAFFLLCINAYCILYSVILPAGRFSHRLKLFAPIIICQNPPSFAGFKLEHFDGAVNQMAVIGLILISFLKIWYQFNWKDVQ